MNSKYFSLLLVISTILLTELALMNLKRAILSETSSVLYRKEFRPPPFEVIVQPQCKNSSTDMLDQMTQGRWMMVPFTERQKRDLEEAVEIAWKLFAIPRLLQRSDNLCGNVSYEKGAKFRALCDPYGSFPCCYKNRCVQMDIDSCKCEDCYDVRQTIHAELAEWIPTDPATKIYYFQGHNDSCESLKNMTIYIVGDSYLRHTYVSMLSVLNSDKKYGPLKNTSSIEAIELCQGLTLYTPRCKYKIERGTARPCNGTVEIQYFEHWKTNELNKTIKVMKKLEGRPNSWIIVGIGVHENYNSGKTISKFLNPLIKSKRESNSTWPKILWSAAHAPGILKSPRFINQQKNGTLDYNTKLREFLNSANIPIFNSFQLTDNTVSFDGTHYGKGVNDLKAQILLNYLACENTYAR